MPAVSESNRLPVSNVIYTNFTGKEKEMRCWKEGDRSFACALRASLLDCTTARAGHGSDGGEGEEARQGNARQVR